MGPRIAAQQIDGPRAWTPRLAKSHSAPACSGIEESVELWAEVEEEADGPKPEPPAEEEGRKASGARKPLGETKGEAVRLRDRERSGHDGETAIKLYLREIGRVRLLTPPEEIALAVRIKKGDKQARELVIKANLPQVVKVARDYEDMGLPLLDLVSEGNLGLLKALAHFDPAKGGTFATYSSWWIRQAIKRALVNQSKAIRPSAPLVRKQNRFRRGCPERSAGG
jgi:DNA-directed RNA polymerase sigma subunit (sigma70/sigma32)